MWKQAVLTGTGDNHLHDTSYPGLPVLFLVNQVTQRETEIPGQQVVIERMAASQDLQTFFFPYLGQTEIMHFNTACDMLPTLLLCSCWVIQCLIPHLEPASFYWNVCTHIHMHAEYLLLLFLWWSAWVCNGWMMFLGDCVVLGPSNSQTNLTSKSLQ